MKRLILVLILVLSASGMFAAEYKQTYEKKNVYTNHFIYMYEVYDNNELVCYRIDTKQKPSYHKYIECTVISYNEKQIMKLLSGLIDCPENDYYKYISNYSNLIFLNDDYSNNGIGTITERYCYELQ